jgi:hypothetical protein
VYDPYGAAELLKELTVDDRPRSAAGVDDHGESPLSDAGCVEEGEDLLYVQRGGIASLPNRSRLLRTCP